MFRTRAAQVGKADEIVEEELKAFLTTSRERAAMPVLGRLRAHAESLARAEAEKTLAALNGLDEKQQKTVRAMATAIVNKLLHAPTTRLRAEAGQGPLGDAAAELFGLEGEPQSASTTKATTVDEQRGDEVAVLPLSRRR